MFLLHEALEQSASRFSRHTALCFRQETVSFSELNSRANQLAFFLRSKGLKPGERVGVLLDKSIEQAVAIWAIAKTGAVFVVIHPSLKENAVCHIIQDCEMVGLITSFSKLASLSFYKLSSLRIFIGSGDDAANSKCGDFVALSESKTAPVDNLCLNINEDDIASIIYTSGSTGMPKGVVLSHKNIVYGARSVSEYLRITNKDRILSILPFSFDYGLNQMTTAVLQGSSLILKNYLFPEEIIDCIELEGITGVAGIPTIWIQLLKAKNAFKYSFKNLRYITNSGDKLSVSHIQALQKMFPLTKIFLMYGLTEAFRATYLDPQELDRRPESIGKAVPYSEILVINSEGKETAPHEVGELVQGGELVSKGYWNKPDATREKIKQHPFNAERGAVCYSGDLVKRDEDGFIYYVGRNSSMIKSCGYRISPTEVEAIVYKINEVKEVVAFGVKHETVGEKVKLVVTLNGKSSSQDICKKCKELMPYYMVPEEVVIIDKFPTTSSGKIDKNAVVKTHGG